MSQDRFAPPPLELFINFLQSQTELSELTEKGVDAFRGHVRTALPFLPAIILSGQWCDFTCNSFDEAVRALVATTGPAGGGAPDDATAYEGEAGYIVGLLVGLALAHTLIGMRPDNSTTDQV